MEINRAGTNELRSTSPQSPKPASLSPQDPQETVTLGTGSEVQAPTQKMMAATLLAAAATHGDGGAARPEPTHHPEPPPHPHPEPIPTPFPQPFPSPDPGSSDGGDPGTDPTDGSDPTSDGSDPTSDSGTDPSDPNSPSDGS